MDVRKIFTENAEEEQWRMLLHYTYPHNIKRHLEKNGVSNPSNELVEGISGSISQAKEYYDACKGSSLQIAPLLLYYGTTNLLYGIINLISGKSNVIKDHGMALIVPSMNCRVADLQIKPMNPGSGALSVFNNVFSASSDFCGYGDWTAMEIFGSIPDILDDFLNCYDDGLPYVLPVEVVKQRRAIIERIEISFTERFHNVSEALSKIEHYSRYYLPYQHSEQISKVILRRKFGSEETGVYSISGQKYLKLGHEKTGKIINPSIIILMYIGLYALGYVCRYRPEYWNPFVRNDISGEKLLVEKFLFFSRRIIPNLVINYFHNTRIQFSTDTQGVMDFSSNTTKEEIEEIVRDEIRKSVERERMKM